MSSFNKFNDSQKEILEMKIVNEYKKVAMRLLKLSFPTLSNDELIDALDYSIISRMKNGKAVIDNNYKHKQINIDVLHLAEYVMTREPIITPYGVMFKKHAEAPNPIAKLLETFMEGRNIYKKEMFKYPKGSEEFEKFNLLQLLAKIDANGFYGACGMYSCLYYNLHVAASVTTQGRACISAAGLQFEMFLANNVLFGSLDEIVTYIDNVCQEHRKYDDRLILDENITHAECFYKLMTTSGFNYIPSEEDMDIVWGIICNLTQQDLNRLYYKNNLFSFMENKSMERALIYILSKLESPFLDPNKPPKEISVELDELNDIIMEYVYYSHQIIDRLDRYDNMIRKVCIITDTDSCIISLDAWYRFVFEKIQNIDLKIKHEMVPMVGFLEKDEFGDLIDGQKMVEILDEPVDYDFYQDEIVQMSKAINPIKIIPQEGVRYSIINILAYCIGNVINDYMEKFTMHSNSYDKNKKCLLIMKNEFLFKRILLMDVKKNYASIQELQEGNIVPKGKQQDIKGLMMGKSNLNKRTQERLQEIMYEEVLTCDEIDELRLIKELAKFENEIYRSLESGEKKFYKPVTIKSINNYENPMRIQGIKASIVWNAIKDEGLEAIDLSSRNGIDLLKVIINPKKITHFEIEEPELFQKLTELMKQKDYASGIDCVAVPKNVEIPKWLTEFIDYKTIINDNAKHFPIEQLNIYRGNDNNNYTNILKL